PKMITLNTLEDINWENVQAVAYDEEKLEISADLLAVVESGRKQFQALIDAGVSCYGVTTGLGKLVSLDLSDDERADLPHNILRARAAAIGPPFSRPIVRATMMLKLTNFLSGRDGVTPELCTFLVNRLNDGFTPWMPSLGHGMGADAIAHTHCFQTFIGEGFVLAEGSSAGVSEKVPAADALKARGVDPMRLGQKEGIALLNGVAAAPAYALDAHRMLSRMLRIATQVSAVSMEGCACPKDSFSAAILPHTAEPGIHAIIQQLRPLLANSQITPYKLQAGISYRIVPQVHGALDDALENLKQRIEAAMQTFSDNPLMTDVGFLSVGSFQGQHLVNQADAVAVALAHVGVLSVRRLHRLLDGANTGLNPQLAARPGLDAGLVVAQKAALGLEARLKILANPVSIHTGESSNGQEDYMSMAFPTISRLYDMAELIEMMLAYELMGGLTALNQRAILVGLQHAATDVEKPGDGVRAIQALFADVVSSLDRDRPPGPDVEKILDVLRTQL
ncbi:MAG: aromatic amino acid lyase, partial [Chloroflexota bacterium]